MREHSTSHLIVVADESSPLPIGVLSTLDIARVFARAGRPRGPRHRVGLRIGLAVGSRGPVVTARVAILFTGRDPRGLLGFVLGEFVEPA